MSHPIREAPPVAATLGRLRHHIHDICHTPDRYSSADLAALRAASMELAKVADGQLNRRAKL
jgi:hypothetical protein